MTRHAPFADRALVSSRHPCARRLNQRCIAVALALIAWASSASAEELQPRPSLENALAPFVETHCLSCHAGDEAEAGLHLDKLLEAPSAAHRRREWQRVLERVERGEMPPEEVDQPTPEEKTPIVAWLKAELADPDCSQPQDPGHVTLRRLNRVEYRNTVRDLVGVDFDAAAQFPRDELGFGFDNNGDVLAMPPILLEKYLQSAEEIAGRAITTPESIVEPAKFFPWGWLEGGTPADEKARGQYTNGRVWAEMDFVEPGEYLLRARVYATQAGDEPTRMKVFVGDQELRTVDVTAEEEDPAVIVTPFTADQGKRQVGVEFINDEWHPEAADRDRRDRNLYVMQIDVVGPITDEVGAKLPEAQRRLLYWKPTTEQWDDADDWVGETRELIARLLIRAYRRPPTPREINRLIDFADDAHDRGDSFERAMQLVLEATLVSPQFLFRGEQSEQGDAKRIEDDEEGEDEPNDDSLRIQQLDEYALATRLSYLFWSTMPDDVLLKLAADGQLRQQLDQEVTRLLDSPRANDLIRNFGEQWLEARQLEGMQRNAELFPEYDDALRDAFRQETFLLLQDVIRNDRPLSTLVSADYSFVNARLAKHYGMPEPEGDEFVRAELPAERRAGVLAHGSVLALTSHDDRTAPVLRGKWVLDRLLADPPAPPPPGVSTLPEATGDLAGKSFRERLEIHRDNPSCSVCHNRMDPLGLAMENFDAVGRWREYDGDDKINAQGQLPDGRELEGPAGLRDVLMQDFARVRRSLAENLLTYALGRGLEPYDTCAVNEIVAATEAGGDTFESMVRAIVKCNPFQKRSY